MSNNSPYPVYGGYPPPTLNGTVSTLNTNSGGTYDYEAQNPLGPTPAHKEEMDRALLRTPSPTPSERKELAREGVLDWKALGSWRFWFRREWLWYYVIGVLLCAIFALMTLYHKQIVEWLKPAAEWMKELKVGFLIPIAVLFVISFPPLFGHEIVAVLCGLVWGLGWGFAIVAAGTFLGEVGNFYAFKYCCRSRGEKLEQQQISYGCLAKIVRDGGFKIALIARLSAIPGHFTTAVFSTCGMGIVVFSLAAILSLPKQFITVYLGVVLEQAEEGHVDTKTHIINYSVIGATFAITVAAMWYMYHEMNKVKPAVIYERRKRRQAKLIAAANAHSNYLNPNHPAHVNRPSPYGSPGALGGATDSSSSLTAFVADENAAGGAIPMRQQQYPRPPNSPANASWQAPFTSGLAQPTPVRVPNKEPSFDAYADFGGRPEGVRRTDTGESAESAESTDALVPSGIMHPGAPTIQYSMPPSVSTTTSAGGTSANQSIRAIPRPAASPNQTPTQTQFSSFPSTEHQYRLASPGMENQLASPVVLPTPIYTSSQQPHHGAVAAFHIGGAGGHVSPSASPVSASSRDLYTQQQRGSPVPVSPATYHAQPHTPGSAPLANPFGASPAQGGYGAFAAQQQQQGHDSPIGSGAPSPVPAQVPRTYSARAEQPSAAVPYSPVQLHDPPPYAAGHGREETGDSYHTASSGSEGEPHSRGVTEASAHSYVVTK